MSSIKKSLKKWLFMWNIHESSEDEEKILRELKSWHDSTKTFSYLDKPLSFDSLNKIPLKFSSSHDYLMHFLPLFLIETKSMINHAIETNLSDPLTVTSIGGIIPEGDEICIILYVEENEDTFFRNDLVLLKQGDSFTNFGIIRSIDRKCKIYLTMKKRNVPRLRGTTLIYHIGSLVPILREFEALYDFPSLEDTIRNQLLQNSSAKTKEKYFIMPEKLNQQLTTVYNSSQMEAINSALKLNGITLIQGPPGTGKTTTIIGIISALLHAISPDKKKKKKPSETLQKKQSSPSNNKAVDKDSAIISSQPWIYNSNYTNWYDKTPAKVPAVTEKYILKGEETAQRRLLVCAPSNAGVDEIVRRVVADINLGGGIYNHDGVKYTPKIVRVGRNTHSSLIEYSLDNLINRSRKEKVLDTCDIVFATLNACGSDILDGMFFDTVIIDEAGQGVETLTLISLKHRCSRLILVGDTNQLPPTVFSRLAIRYNYNQSLFARLESLGVPKNILTIQFRMHPLISHFPSKAFYENKIENATDIYDRCKPLLFWYQIPIFKPQVFFSMESHEKMIQHSYWNPSEVIAICNFMQMLKLIFKTFDPEYNWMSKTAIISPYNEQIAMIKILMKAILGLKQSEDCPVDISTVDGFQGQEKDYILFSLVRGQGANLSSIGFVANKNRMNVAITRARCNIWFFGNANALKTDPAWKSLLKDIRNRGCAYKLTKNSQNFFLKVLKKHLEKFIDDPLLSQIPKLYDAIKDYDQDEEKSRFSDILNFLVNYTTIKP